MVEEERKKFSEIRFTYYPGEARYYYLVTGTSGYSSADFRYPGWPGGGRGNLVVPEVRTDSADLFLPHAFPQSIPEPEE
ncbi:MAG: hypothetical protein AB1652_04870 [Bacillota bacterium]